MLRRSPLLLAVCLSSTFGLAEGPDSSFPPVPIPRSLYVLDVPFLHLSPVEEPPPAGTFAIGFDAAYGNTFSHSWHPRAIHEEYGRLGLPFGRDEAEELHLRHPQDAMFFIDGEVTRIALRGTLGLSKHLAVAIEVPWVSWDLANFDGAIEGFHNLVGLGSSQRDAFPRGQFVLMRQFPSGRLEFDDRNPGSGLGDVTASLLYRRPLPGGARLSADLVLKAPTGSSSGYRGSGSFDAGFQVGLEKRLGGSGRWNLRLEVGAVVPGPWRSDGPVQLQVSPFLRALVAGQLRLGQATYATLAVVVEQSPLRAEASADWARTSVEVGLGLTRRIGSGATVELGLLENVPHYGDAPDIVLTLGLRLHP